MIDDLDALLSDVDRGQGSKLREEEGDRMQERIARKSDRPVVDSGNPRTEHSHRQRIDELKLNGDLDPFRNGPAAAVDAHTAYSSQFRETVFSNLISESVANVIKKHRYSYEKSIGNIEQLVTEFLAVSSSETLQKKSRQDFHLFFANQEMTDGKLQFLVVKELFLRIREFNSKIGKEWTDLQKNIGAINMVTEGKQLNSLCFAVTAEALSFCDKTYAFVKFLGAMLSLGEGDLDLLEREIVNKAVYFVTGDYDYMKALSLEKKKSDDLDDEFLDLGVSGIQTDKDEKTFQSESENICTDSGELNQEEEPCVPQHAAKIQFTVRGSSAWNTREPYVIRIDAGKLVKDYSDLENSIYYNADIPDPVTVNGHVKRAMILFMKNPERHILNEYGEFIFRFISFRMDMLFDFFGFAGETAKLFVYHLAPQTVFKIVHTHFNESGQGLCFKLLPGNKVSRYIPLEYLKERTLLWYEENINPLDLPFDRVSDFNEIKRAVQDKFYSEKTRCHEKADAVSKKLFEQSGKLIEPHVILAKKQSELFGSAQIAVYNRFVGGTGLRPS